MSQWVLLSIQVVASAVLVWAVLAVRAASKRYEDCVASVSEAARSLRWGQAVAPCRSRQAPSPIARERRERAVADTFDPFTITWDLPGRVSEELEEVQEQAAANLRKATELSSELAALREFNDITASSRSRAAAEGGGVMVRRVQTKIADAADELRDRLVQAQERRLSPLLSNPEEIRASVGDDLYERAGARTDWEAARASLAAVREFVSHASGIAVGEQGEGGLLGSVSDEVEGLGEAADLLDLCRAFELGGLGGPGPHVGKGFVEGLVSGLHDDSSSVGGDGDPDGGPAPSPVDGSTDPTEEAQSSEAASADEGRDVMEQPGLVSGIVVNRHTSRLATEVAALRASAVETERRTFVVQVSGEDLEAPVGDARRSTSEPILIRAWTPAGELLLEAGSVVRTTRVQDQARGLEPVSCRFDGSPKGICGLNVGDSVVIKRMDEGPRSGASDVDIHNSCTVSHANECFCHGVDVGREHLFDDKCGKRVHRDAGSGRDEARAVHDSSSVGGDGAMDGGPAPSPVDGSTDPTEEASPSDVRSGWGS
ncbi:Mic19 family protein [Actinomyces bowdenii]|uniref:Mic19 family protein n=1 Tax=Actinomyces bowdenii TaxID=131109 RepID=UPI00214C46CE|nr:Mic19 family protein [Actinomyces bowdenii]MCR2052004.1 Mic19 family protein [Actinomyces bowdenii]